LVRTLSNMADSPAGCKRHQFRVSSLLGAAPACPRFGPAESPDWLSCGVARPMVDGNDRIARSREAGGVIVYSSGFAEPPNPIGFGAAAPCCACRTDRRACVGEFVGLANTRFSGGGLNSCPDTPPWGKIVAGPIGIVLAQSGALGYTVCRACSAASDSRTTTTTPVSAVNLLRRRLIRFQSPISRRRRPRSIIWPARSVQGPAAVFSFLAAAAQVPRSRKGADVYKTGNSENLQQAAMSHTGTMVGSVVAYSHCDERRARIAVAVWKRVGDRKPSWLKSRAPSGGRRRHSRLIASGGAGRDLCRQAEAHERAAACDRSENGQSCSKRGPFPDLAWSVIRRTSTAEVLNNVGDVLDFASMRS